MLSKKFALGFGIAIILPMLIYYGVSTFSPAPKWAEYYNYNNLNNQDYKNTPEQRIKLQQDRQQEIQKKQEDYKIAEKSFQSHLFCVEVPIGIIAILFGAFTSVQAIGTGLMFGGIFTLTQGYMCYWSELQDWMRFSSLLIAFGILIYIGYRKLAK